MSKSILVIDTPDSCGKCKLRSLGDDCLPEGKHVIKYRHNRSKPDWCPLRLMPKKDNDFDEENEYYMGWAYGWNSCINEIEGGDYGREESNGKST